MKSLFVATNEKVTAAVILELFKPELSAEGSNHYMKETEAVALWRDFIQEMEGNNDC